MNVMFDSNTIVAFLVEDHAHHEKAYHAYLKYALDKNNLFITTHSIAEIYRTLTWGVEYLNYSADQANEVIQSTVLPVFENVELSGIDYTNVLNFMKKSDLTGAIIYDALIAHASQKVEAEELVTFNIKDFRRVWPLTNADLIEP